ncbi:MAG: alpha/beta hydrolase [Myxococcales bacterium]|nr:alpha/beta hydrolase [Myxococcales bacterium]
MQSITPADALHLFHAAPQRYLDVGDGAVAYRRVGAGPDVLFVHGWPASGATFRGLLPALAPHVTCHLLDLVGAGQSRFDRGTRVDLRRHIADVRAVVDALGLDDIAVVAHDSGGLIARHALAGDPRVRSMALVSTEQPQGLNWRFRQFLLMAKLPGFEHALSWAASRRRLRRSPYLLGDCFHDRALLDGEFEALYLAPLRDDPARRWAAGEFGRNFDPQLVRELAEVHARITAPVQLVWGEDDPFFPVARAREMVSTFPNAQLRVVPRAKLFVHEERPAEVAAAILPTLLRAPAIDATTASA